MSDYIFAIKACIDNRKNLLNSDVSSTSIYQSIMANFGPLTAEICWRVWRMHSSKFQRVGFVTLLHRRRSPEANQTTKLYTMFGRLLYQYVVYTFSAALAPSLNFARCRIHFASKFCVLLYWQRTARHSSSGRQPNFAALRSGRHLYSAGRPSRWASAHILVSSSYDRPI